MVLGNSLDSINSLFFKPFYCFEGRVAIMK